MALATIMARAALPLTACSLASRRGRFAEQAELATFCDSSLTKWQEKLARTRGLAKANLLPLCYGRVFNGGQRKKGGSKYATIR